MEIVIIDVDGFLWAPMSNKNLFEKISEQKFTSVSSSYDYDYTMAIDEDGFLWAFGDNEFGQLSIGDKKSTESFEKVPSQGLRYLQVICCSLRTFAIDENGFLWSCGSNQSLQLGSGCGSRRETVTKHLEKISEERFFMVSCGSRHVMALDENGFLWACGDNFNGQLGLGDKQNRYSLTKINEQRFISVSCGFSSTVALDENGFLWACGTNNYGQLGFGDNQNRYTLEKISNQRFVKMSRGTSHTAALDENGFLWSYINNSESNKNLLQQVSTQRFKNVVCIGFQTFAVDTNNLLWVSDHNNQLVKVENMVNVKELMNTIPKKRGINTKSARKL